jgi:uroporphyrinogen-III synthase
MTMGRLALSGRRIVTTRDAPGRLDELLAHAGAEVVHVPLIKIGEPPDQGKDLAEALGDLDRFDWVVVTSRHGAERVVGALGSSSARPTVRTAAVGTATAAALERGSDRGVDLVPAVQQASALVEAFARLTEVEAAFADRPVWSMLIAQADRAADTLAEGLRALGHRVRVVTAYSTHLRPPDPGEVAAALQADAVVFASGSAALSWARTIGVRTPPVVIVIGPTTARVATSAGLEVTEVATDSSLDGVVAAAARVLGPGL